MMTKEEALQKVEGYLTDAIPYDSNDEVEVIMSALRQPDELSIVKDLFRTNMLKDCETCQALKPEGEWINILPCTTNFQDQVIYQCVCDRCGSKAYFRRMYKRLVGANLCPNCGAKMRTDNEV